MGNPYDPIVTQASGMVKSVNGISTEAAGAAKDVEESCKSGPPTIDGIRKECSHARGLIAGWEKTLETAGKVPPSLDKFKDPPAINASKLLKEAIAKAEKAITSLEGSIDIAEKLADKADKEDDANGNAFKKIQDAAEDSIHDMTTIKASCEGYIELFRENFKKLANNPAGLKKQQQINLNTIKPDVAKLGALITTGESIKSSIPNWVKKSATTLDPTVRKQLADGTLLERKLATAIADGRMWHTNLQAEIKTTETKIAAIKA